ncbi:Copper-transporting ATPase ccc2 [Neolecta irregularis DAH-3]|uniref:Copper-transporting ATPase ccc2 n=1 Tax=Neolecta irregularis (strain DAH-3) TaxID=1198029 RepID=A0A1U7LPX4_NEOID|nr:Copper-transporting ATPase ccc2 [Neolecta irregularis DAH-3]|eukprot:OLL24571.1 Copper-transporting ATPase ccc2 [Neolecta irregularis DAH-3]
MSSSFHTAESENLSYYSYANSYLNEMTGSALVVEAYKVHLSIGGMTSKSCAEDIKSALEKYDFIKDINIDLSRFSASVVVESQDQIRKVRDIIKEKGFDASVMKVGQVSMPELSIKPSSELMNGSQSPPLETRTLDIRVSGLHYMQVNNTVLHKGLSDLPITSVQIPPVLSGESIITVAYIPAPPVFTARSIFNLIYSLGFSTELVSPPVPEELARASRIKEQRASFLRLVACSLLAIPTVIIGIIYMTILPESMSTRFDKKVIGNVSVGFIILLVLATPAQFMIVYIFLRRALQSLWILWRRGSKASWTQRFLKFGSMDLLVSLGSTVSYVASLIFFIISAVKAPNDQVSIATSLDCTVLHAFFVFLGTFLESYNNAQTAKSPQTVSCCYPKTALLEEHGELLITRIELIEVDDVVRILPGAVAPVDGQSAYWEIHGRESIRWIRQQEEFRVCESASDLRQHNASKFTINSNDDRLENIVSVICESRSSRSTIENLGETVAAYYMPIIIYLSVTTLIVWLLITLSGGLSVQALNKEGGLVIFCHKFGITVLLIGSPCGMALAVPSCLIAGTKLLKKKNITVQGPGEAIYDASCVDIVVFDKTGTITQGILKITDWRIADQFDKVARLLLNALEEESAHPIAAAILDWVGNCDSPVQVRDIEEIPCRGIHGFIRVNRLEYDAIVGNEVFMINHEALLAPGLFQATLDRWKEEGKSITLLAVRISDSAPFIIVAQLAASDLIRPEAPGVIAKLKAKGISVWCISGDDTTTTLAISRKVGIPVNNVMGCNSPDQKSVKIKQLQHSSLDRRKKIVAMVGDGINDAAALASADVGIALSNANQVARNSANFVMTGNGILALIDFFTLAQAIHKRVGNDFEYQFYSSGCWGDLS